MPVTIPALNRSPEFANGFAVGALFSTLTRERPREVTADFHVDTMEQIFLTISRCGYRLGAWERDEKIPYFTCTMTRRDS
jgi:hypothetical protein